MTQSTGTGDRREGESISPEHEKRHAPRVVCDPLALPAAKFRNCQV
jgi:hypothetical protein